MRIIIHIEGNKDTLRPLVQKLADKLSLEGVVQPVTDTKLRIVACGSKNGMDDFLDALHDKLADGAIDTIEIEPFLKDRDYRGVFRVIE